MILMMKIRRSTNFSMVKSNSFLIDTEIFIWGMEKSSKLSSKVRLLLENQENQIFISIASIWEMVIKGGKGKLKLPKNIEEDIEVAGFKILPIEVPHVLAVKELPNYQDHKDPFDRILISQAKVENLTLITSDPKIWKYKITMLRV